jgi:3-methyl-2-oxobutanoate hydroxymethyltransferase
VTVEMMNHHLETVTRTRPRSLVVADMPYLSFHLSRADTVANAGGFIRRGAAAVKLEGGAKRLDMIHALIDCEIPVMGHLGLTPQSLNAMGGHRVQGRSAFDATAILEDAQRLEEAGCFSIVLEGIPAELGEKITRSISIPTIGIGAGPGCSGQVLVFHDLLGLLPGHKAKFVRTYLEGLKLMQGAIGQWADDIRSGAFPGPAESYALPEESRAAVEAWKPKPREGT